MLVVLHAAWVPAREARAAGVLCLWGESAPAHTGRRQQGGRQGKAAGEIAPHPFAATPEDLTDTLGSLSSTDLPGYKPGFIGLLLPTIGSAPQPSPEMAGAPGSGDGQAPRLQAWKAPCLALQPDAALPLLARLPEVTESQAEGIRLGSDLRYWSKVGKLALDLLARQRFIPTLSWDREAQGSTPVTWWQAVLQDAHDGERLALLARAMPPICRAALSATTATGKQPDHPNGPERSPRALVESFIGATIDGSVRRWVADGLSGNAHGKRRATRSAQGQWLAALQSKEATLNHSIPGLADLADSLGQWTAGLQGQEAPFRICLRVDPPAGHGLVEKAAGSRPPVEEQHPWALRFFLQPGDDRSLLVPADRVWKERRNTMAFLNRRFDHPQERLLEGLGRASRLFAPLERSLQSARPEACFLSVNEAYSFLKEAAPLLEESGIGVLVPPWWERRRTALGARLRVKPRSGSQQSAKAGLSLDTLVDYQWDIALGEQSLSWDEFQRLAEMKVPLVQVRGEWVEFRPDQIEAALRMFEEGRSSGEMALRDALRLGLGQEGETDGGLPVAGVASEGWIAGLVGQLSAGEKAPELPPPPSFHGELRPYQVRGYSWLAFLRQWGLGACLADDMGLGKTIQLIAFLLRDRKDGRRRRPVLLICPMSLVGNWQREVARFGPSLRVMVHHGAERAAGLAFQKEAAGHDLVISTYSLAHRDVEGLAAVRWEGVVLDEAQNIKNPGTKQTQAIRSLKGDYRIALTGTPVENRLRELWSIMEFLNPGFLGAAADFQKRFAIPIERYQDVERSSSLKRLVQPFILRRLKTDSSIIRDLPEKQEMKVFCNLTQEQATLYEAVLKDMLLRIEQSTGIERKGLVLATIAKLKQVCNHPAHFLKDGSPLEGRSGKLARLKEMLEETLGAGDRVLVFTQFREMGDMLQAYLESVFRREALFLHGGVPQKARDRMVARFQEPKGPPFFILSLKAGGVGLNLTGANHVFHFDRWWNPAVENQATDRAFRIGQQKNVQVHKFVCTGTMEERIDSLIESKRALAESIVGAGEGWLTELSTDELRDIFSLRREMVSAE